MCSLGYCHAFLLSTAGVDGLELSTGTVHSNNPSTPALVIQNTGTIHVVLSFYTLQSSVRIMTEEEEINLIAKMVNVTL